MIRELVDSFVKVISNLDIQWVPYEETIDLIKRMYQKAKNERRPHENGRCLTDMSRRLREKEIKNRLHRTSPIQNWWECDLFKLRLPISSKYISHFKDLVGKEM